MKTTVRATIMLAVLVGLPAAWVYYGPLPVSAQRVVDRFVSAAKEAVNWDKAPPAPSAPAVPLASAPLASLPVTRTTAPTAAAPLVAAPPAAVPIEPLLARLRELGVLEYALERWGAAGELYRFHCEMPLGTSGGLTQQFEAVAADPRSSVEQVVTEVASWHVARAGGERIVR